MQSKPILATCVAFALIATEGAHGQAVSCLAGHYLERIAVAIPTPNDTHTLNGGTACIYVHANGAGQFAPDLAYGGVIATYQNLRLVIHQATVTQTSGGPALCGETEVVNGVATPATVILPAVAAPGSNPWLMEVWVGTWHASTTTLSSKPAYNGLILADGVNMNGNQDTTPLLAPLGKAWVDPVMPVTEPLTVLARSEGLEGMQVGVGDASVGADWREVTAITPDGWSENLTIQLKGQVGPGTRTGALYMKLDCP
jgi:hypothetical protein